MRLTWREGITTLLVIVVGLVYYAYATGMDIAVINETRGALLVMGIAGLGVCITGGSAGIVGRNWYTGLMSVLGIAVTAVFIIGLITEASWTVMWFAIGIAVMWGIALVYRLFGAPVHGPSAA